jgi:hypothetical protein
VVCPAVQLPYCTRNHCIDIVSCHKKAAIVQTGTEYGLDITETDVNSVADTGCLSRIPDPDFSSRIPDPKTAMKDIGKKQFVVIPFIWSHKFHKIELFNFLIFEEKNLGQFSKNYRTFYPKNCL